MDIPRIKTLLAQGREIELYYNGKLYFLAPSYLDGESIGKYSIYDDQEQCTIFVGGIDAVLAFDFANGNSLDSAFHLFDIAYVL